MRLARSLQAVLLAAGLVGAGAMAGCSGQRVYFRPVSHQVGPGGEAAERARYTLAADGGSSAEATLSVQGLPGNPRDKDPRNHRDRLTVSVAVRNGLEREVVLPLSDAHVLDDDGRTLTAPRLHGEQAEGGQLLVPPGGRGRATLVFEFPEDDGLARIGSLRLFWTARVGEKSEQFETKFLRTAEPEVYYAAPYPPYYYHHPWGPYGYPFGYPYWGYPYGYWWGPGYPRSHIGLRFHYHH